MHQITLDECLMRMGNGKEGEDEQRPPAENTGTSRSVASANSGVVVPCDETNDDNGDWNVLTPLPRRKRKVRSRDRATGRVTRLRNVSHRSADSRFKQKILGEKQAVPIMSLCSVDDLVRELDETNGNTDRLERAVTEAARLAQRNRDVSVDISFRALMSAVVRGQTFLERMKNGCQALFTPDTWTFPMVHFNAYEEGVRYKDLFFRSCSESNCVSTYVRTEVSHRHLRLCECLNADAVKKILTSDKSALKYANSFGRHCCLLCTIQEIYSFCTNPLSDHVVTAEAFAAKFSFQFVGLRPEFEIQCQFTAPNGVNVNYRCINIDAALDHLTWKFDDANKLHYIDFSPLFKTE